MTYVTRKSKKHNKEMLKLMGNLYGDKENHPWRSSGDDKKPVKVKKVNTTPTEFEEQCRLVVELQKRFIPFAASANGGSRHPAEARNLKLSGVTPGWPDIVVPVKSNRDDGYAHLYCEMKRRRGGVVTDCQRYQLDTLKHYGSYTFVARGWNEGLEKILWYLEMDENEKFRR